MSHSDDDFAGEWLAAVDADQHKSLAEMWPMLRGWLGSRTTGVLEHEVRIWEVGEAPLEVGPAAHEGALLSLTVTRWAQSRTDQTCGFDYWYRRSSSGEPQLALAEQGEACPALFFHAPASDGDLFAVLIEETAVFKWACMRKAVYAQIFSQ